MAYRLYGVNVSPYVRKVRAYLAEKGLGYDLDPVNPFAPPAGFRDLSPLGKIPAFRDGEKTLADSSIICTYLERQNPEPALYPADDYAYARALWFEEYIDGAFAPKAGNGVFFPLVLAPMMRNQPVTDAVRAGVERVVREELAPMWDYLEKAIGSNEFLVDDRLSIADLAVASVHVNLDHAGIDLAAARWPNLAGFLQRMHARPSFKSLIEEERPTWSQRGKAG